MKQDEWKWPLGLIALIIGAALFVHYQPHKSGDVAAWVQAIGSIGAIIAAVTVVQWQHHLAQEVAKEAARQRYRSLLRVSVVVAEELSQLLSLASKTIRDTKDVTKCWSAVAGMTEDVTAAVRGMPLIEFVDGDADNLTTLRRIVREVNLLASASVHLEVGGDSAAKMRNVVDGWNAKVRNAEAALKASLESCS